VAFFSILFDRSKDRADTAGRHAPSHFSDLNLDQIVASITAGRKAYDLEPLFYTPLNDVESVKYRHEVLRDLASTMLLESLGAFAQGMQTMRHHLAQADKLRYKYQKESWILDAVELYCDAVNRLADNLMSADITSRGFLGLRSYLAAYVQTDSFTSLRAETRALREDLSQVRYCLHIRGNRVTVSKYDAQADYSAEVEETFHRFKQGTVKDYRVAFSNTPDMDHVEAGVLNLVARLYFDTFLELDQYCERYRSYLDETIRHFDREVQFYLAYLEYIEPLRSSGMGFCVPNVCDQSKDIYAFETFDLALAKKLQAENSAAVCNDFHLRDQERILVVSGPNQGGKTTLARTFGQLHYLASLGCPVPGRDSQLFLFDRVFTHFEREEDITDLRGKLQDDLVRIHEILTQASGNSIMVMNEIFTSTTVNDGLFLSKKIMTRIIELDLLCVWVTFLDELASQGPTTVSMVSTVVPEDPALRTYKLIRKPADGLAYAGAIAEKYGLTYDSLKGRLRR
jgi:DNA mismatch repair protein MutS